MAAVTKNRTYGKIAGFGGNNSKNVINIRNLTRVKMSTARSNYPAIFK